LALDFVYSGVAHVLFKHAGAVGEKMVHRILKELKTGGYISIGGRHIKIEKKLASGW
jgi:hypothetical protein